MRVAHTLHCVAAAALLAGLLTGCAPAPRAVPAAPRSVESAQPAPAPSETFSPTPTPEPEPGETTEPPPSSPEASPTPDETPTTAPILAPGDQGDDVRDLQHRLLQLQWYQGSITPNYGPETQAAVEGFQAKRGLPVTGTIDDATLKVLHDMTRAPTRDEMYNVLVPGPAILRSGDRSDAVRDLQARLRQIGWYGAAIDGIYGKATVEAVRGFQGKRAIPVTGEVDQRTLDRLHAMTRKPTQDELRGIAPSQASSSAMRLDPRCLTGRAICISKKQRKLAWVVDGQIHMQMAVRFGSSKTPTREGAFRVEWKSRNHVSKLYDSAMPYALFFSGGQAVHYSSDFAARGYEGASHGCVNVRDKAKVAKLFDLAKVGDKVIVYSD